MAVLIPSKDGITTPMLNLAEGGQQGFMTDPLHYLSSQPYVTGKMRAVLISAPSILKYMEGHMGMTAKEWYAAFKSMIELLPIKVDGLKSSVTWDYDGPVVGNAGEKMEACTGAKRETSAPSFSWPEKQGLAITNFWTEIGRVCIMDPDLQVPGVVAFPAYIADNSPPITSGMQAFTALFFEPDNTLTRITKAWLCTNMMQRSGGEIIGVNEVGGSLDTPTVDIEFTSMTLIGKAPKKMALDYLKTNVSLKDLRPLELHAFGDQNGKEYTGVDSTVASAANGLAKEVTAAVMK